MIRLVLFMVLLLIAALLFVVARRPARSRVQRSIHIDAPREKLFALVSDSTSWIRLVAVGGAGPVDAQALFRREQRPGRGV